MSPRQPLGPTRLSQGTLLSDCKVTLGSRGRQASVPRTPQDVHTKHRHKAVTVTGARAVYVGAPTRAALQPGAHSSDGCGPPRVTGPACNSGHSYCRAGRTPWEEGTVRGQLQWPPTSPQLAAAKTLEGYSTPWGVNYLLVTKMFPPSGPSPHPGPWSSPLALPKPRPSSETRYSRHSALY